MVFQSMQSVFLDELVDFEDQQRRFEEMLDHSASKRLMLVQAPGMCGKTSLLRILRFHCEQKGIPRCWIDFRGQSYDNPHFTLARDMCDQLGLSPRHMYQALQPFNTGQSVDAEVAAHAEASTEVKGDVIDSYVVTQVLTGVSVTRDDLRQRYMKERLKRAFITDLGDFAVESRGVACFFDSFEDISAEEEDWLLDALLCPIAEGALKGVMVVTAGRRWPEIDRWGWEKRAHLIDNLPSMSVKHIKVYARKVGVEITDEQAKFCWRASRGGNPLFMGMVVKNLQAVGEVGS